MTAVLWRSEAHVAMSCTITNVRWLHGKVWWYCTLQMPRAALRRPRCDLIVSESGVDGPQIQ